ncbi:hypothetical protein DL769_010246 [Monosporascus sp. CRB-8-3]|nr:hypothetical protein DL769_010246 [Monosporascus sp. CRB-8-3]
MNRGIPRPNRRLRTQSASNPKPFGKYSSHTLPGKKCEALSTPGQYYIWADTQSREYNCFSFAVGELEKNLRPQTWRQLDEAYARYGYYRVNKLARDGDVIIKDRDVEVYAKPRDAHPAPSTPTASSTQPQGCVPPRSGSPSSYRTAARFPGARGGHRPVTTGAL